VTNTEYPSVANTGSLAGIIFGPFIMTDKDKQLLTELDYGIITINIFFKNFSVDIKEDTDFVKAEMTKAIATSDADEIQMALALIWLSGDISKYVEILNELLINPNHKNHQLIARNLQFFAPSTQTVPFVRKALESNFDYLEYCCSDSRAIAKWFSWLLYSIGTTEAIELMKEYSNSSNKGIREEMLYRLNKFDIDKT
jgi:hypothetical protein